MLPEMPTDFAILVQVQIAESLTCIPEKGKGETLKSGHVMGMFKPRASSENKHTNDY